MRPYQINTTALPTADPDAIASAQTLSTAGPLALNAVVIAAPSYITITTVDDETGVNFTIEGTSPAGNPQSVTIAGGNNTTVTTTAAFASVNSVITDAGTTDDVEVGLAQGGYSPWYPLDIYTPNQVTTISATVSGTVNYSIEYTNEDPFDPSITQTPVVHPAAGGAFTSASTNQTHFTTTLMRAVRYKINSGGGTLRLTITQQSTA